MSLLTKLASLPLRLKIFGIIAALMIATATTWAGYSYMKGRHEAQAAAAVQLEAAADKVSVERLNAEGARVTYNQARLYNETASKADALVDAYLNSVPENLNEEPVPADRAARLRAADIQLCAAAPELEGCSGAKPADRNP